jgi:dTDP-4-amino-4,6-dideoxygalactose transaminase
MAPEDIPFNKPFMTGQELRNIGRAHANGQLAGNGPFTKDCERWLQERTGCAKALLTHSCTAALEMAALLLDIQPGDEVILPSYTFVSTANAFVLRGGVPVFVDIRRDTFNLDETLVEAAIGPRTRAIVPVHYAGVACEMDSILATAARHGLSVVEDAAQGVLSTYKGRALGSLGHLGAYSFHETKNLISGEGGGLLVNDASLAQRAEIIWEKGTDRGRFFRGAVDKYTWQEAGSSFLPGEVVAAFLWAQFEAADEIARRRMECWERYHRMAEPLEAKGFLARPRIPEHCGHNAHMYQVLLAPGIDRKRLLETLVSAGIRAVFHYVPLHSSPAGRRFGRIHGELPVTEAVSERVLRLPLWVGITEQQQARVVSALADHCAA